MIKTELFLSVIETHKGIIYKVANSYFKDKEDREDLVQEIVLKLWKSFDAYDDQYKYSTWIYRIALNTAISFYRKEKIREKSNLPFSESIFNRADHEIDQQLEQNSIHLNQFISELRELDKALMILYLEEKNHREIAEIIGISETNVATKINRVKAILKEKFSKINT